MLETTTLEDRAFGAANTRWTAGNALTVTRHPCGISIATATSAWSVDIRFMDEPCSREMSQLAMIMIDPVGMRVEIATVYTEDVMKVITKRLCDWLPSSLHGEVINVIEDYFWSLGS